jgi:hypothetical protein
MRLSRVHVGHPEVEAIQPTWHCLLRFRQRVSLPAGTDAAIAALDAALAEAEITTRPPRGIAGRGEPAALWAVSGRHAFPLQRTAEPGVWLAPTCLAGSR